MRGKHIYQYIALFMMAIFVLFAIAQYNDPDAALWIGIYLAAAFVSLLVFLNQIRGIWLISISIVYLAGAIFLWPAEYEGLTMDMDKSMNIEYARESLGLAICFLSLISFYLAKRKVEGK